jgi:hypothetical protein
LWRCVFLISFFSFFLNLWVRGWHTGHFIKSDAFI